MWRKEEVRAPSLPAQAKPTPTTAASQASTAIVDKATTSPAPVVEARLTQSLVIEGEISGRDDLLIDGVVDGKIRLQGGTLTVGPHGRVMADVEAREVVVHGEVTGNIRGQERVRIAATGRAKGEINTRLISIEEGAEVHVRVNIEREERYRPVSAAGADTKPESKTQLPATEQASQVHV